MAATDLLSAYEIERLPVVAQILAANSNLYTHLVQRKTVDDAETQGTNRNGFLRWRNDALFQLDVNYRWSPIVLDERARSKLNEETLKARAYEGYPGGDIQAGDRAPDAPTLLRADGTETSLFSVFTPYAHTVLAFLPVSDAAARTTLALDFTKIYPADVVQLAILKHCQIPESRTCTKDASTYYDPKGHAYNEYGVDDSFTIVVVRPDGYIGAIVGDVKGVETYFSRILAMV